jgi:hypothetical protein
MKHSLITLISFLLLSSPVIGNNNKGETLFRWENPSGDGYVWKGFGNKETHSVYKVDVKNGKPNGVGIFIYSFGGKYEGNWGWFKIPNDGRKYIGEHKGGKRDGQGTYTFPEGGGGYEGEYKEGIKYLR